MCPFHARASLSRGEQRSMAQCTQLLLQQLGSIHHPARTCLRLILFFHFRRRKNDVFQHMHPTSVFLCCHKEPHIQFASWVSTWAYTQVCPATHSGGAAALRTDHLDHTPNEVLQMQNGDSRQHRKDISALQALANSPNTSPSLESPTELSHRAHISAGQPPLSQEQTERVLNSGKQPQCWIMPNIKPHSRAYSPGTSMSA